MRSYPKLDPRYLECFATALSTGVIRAAAEKLGLEPSSVSRQITKLEQILAIPLIVRSRQGVRATEAGELLFEFCRNQSAEQESLLSMLDDIRGMRRGTLKIAVGEGFVGDLLDKALQTFTELYPDIYLQLETGSTETVVNQVLNDEFHFGLAYNPGADPKLHILAKARQSLMVLVSPDHPVAAMAEPIPLSALTKAPAALLNHGFGVRETLKTAESVFNLRLTISVSTNSIAVLKNYVRSNLGIAFLPSFVVVRELKDGIIIAKSLENNPVLGGDACLIARHGLRQPVAGNVLINHIKRHMVVFRSSTEI